MTNHDAAVAVLMGDCLYEEFVMLLHHAGFSTCMDTVNECCVFKIEKPNEFDGRHNFEYKYVGNFKVQGSETIILKPTEYGNTTRSTRITDLADPQLYHKILAFFGMPETELEWFLNHRLEHAAFLSAAKLPKDSVEGSGVN